MSAVGNIFRNLGQKVWSGMRTLGGGVWGTVKGVGHGVGSLVRGDLGQAFEDFRDGLTSPTRAISKLGRSITGGLGLGGVHDALSGIATKVSRGIGHAAGLGPLVDLVEKVYEPYDMKTGERKQLPRSDMPHRGPSSSYDMPQRRMIPRGYSGYGGY
jgi:hypothetical protein